MTFDALTMAAMRDELGSTVRGGQVQRVFLVGERAVCLEIYALRQRHFLLCSAEPEQARLCLIEARPRRAPDVETPFLLLARKYLRDGRVVGIEQPRFERVMKLQVTKPDERGVLGQVALIIEIMGRRSNLVLAGADGLILDAVRRAGRDRNPRRPIVPRGRYLDPPAQNRRDPLDEATYAALRSSASASEPEALEQLLAQHLAGFSPQTAREAAFRASGQLGTPAHGADWGAVREAVTELLEPLSSGQWRPCVALLDGQAQAFAPYRLSHLADHSLRMVSSISAAIELGLGSPTPTRRAPDENEALIVRIERLIAATRRRGAALKREVQSVDQIAALQRAGEAILANLTSVQTDQASFCFAGDEIGLDPRLTPLENAQHYFREYRKARDASRTVPGLLAESNLRLRQLEELRALAEVAETPVRLRVVRDEVAEVEGGALPVAGQEHGSKGHSRGSRRSTARAADGSGRVERTRSPNGLEVCMGTSGRGNDLVTFKLGQPDDLWFHARGVAGAHVVLRTAGLEAPEESVAYAATLAARNSQAYAAGHVEVDYTPRRYVRKIPGAPPGLVTYRNERTLLVTTDR